MAKAKKSFKQIIIYIAILILAAALIVIIGMPSFTGFSLPGMGGLPATSAASVNGKQITFLQVNRQVSMRGRGQEDEDESAKSKQALESLVKTELLNQFAKKNGIETTNETAFDVARNLDMFLDENKNFNKQQFANFLDSYSLTKLEFLEMLKKDIVNNQLFFLLESAGSATPDEIEFESMIRNSNIQIKYAVLSSQEINNLYKDRLAVTEEEINAEMKSNPSELKDPATDRAKFKSKIATRKLDAVKAELEKTVNDIAARGGSFEEAAAAIKAKASTSAPYRLGEQIFDEKDKKTALYSLMNAPEYTEQVLAVESGKSSKAVVARDGIYVFTPIKKEFKPSDEATAKQIAEQISSAKSRAVFSAMYEKFSNEAKIIKTDRFDKKAEE